MSKEKKIMLVLTLITLVIVVVALFFLPDKIPFHFNAKGEAGWFASKYFLLLIIPVPALIYKTKSTNNKK